MEKFFLFKRERKKSTIDESEGFGWGATIRNHMDFDRSVNTTKEAEDWIKNVYQNNEYMVIKGKEIEFKIKETITVDVKVKE